MRLLFKFIKARWAWKKSIPNMTGFDKFLATITVNVNCCQFPFRFNKQKFSVICPRISNACFVADRTA